MSETLEEALAAAEQSQNADPVEEVQAQEPEQLEQEAPQEEQETPDPDDEMAQRVKRAHIEAREAKRKAMALQQELDILKGERSEPRDESIQREALQLAEEIAKQKIWNDSCNQIAEKAKKEFKDFDQVMADYKANFPEWGGIPAPIIEAAMEEPEIAHKILHYYGKNLDEAEHLLTLSPTKQGAAVAKLAAKLANPPAKPVSKASTPIKPISGHASPASKSVDQMTTEEFMRYDDAETKRLHKERWG